MKHMVDFSMQVSIVTGRVLIVEPNAHQRFRDITNLELSGNPYPKVVFFNDIVTSVAAATLVTISLKNTTFGYGLPESSRLVISLKRW